MSEDEKIVRDAMRALRADDERAAPPFARVFAGAERASIARRRRTRALALSGAGVAMAAAVALALYVGWPGEELELAAPGPEPLAFLLDAPSASVTSTASLRRIEESW